MADILSHPWENPNEASSILHSYREPIMNGDPSTLMEKTQLPWDSLDKQTHYI